MSINWRKWTWSAGGGVHRLAVETVTIPGGVVLTALLVSMVAGGCSREDTDGGVEIVADPPIPQTHTYVLGEDRYEVGLPEDIRSLDGPATFGDKDDQPVVFSPEKMAGLHFGIHRMGWETYLSAVRNADYGPPPASGPVPIQGWHFMSRAQMDGYHLCRKAVERIRSSHGEAAVRRAVDEAIARADRQRLPEDQGHE